MKEPAGEHTSTVQLRDTCKLIARRVSTTESFFRALAHHNSLLLTDES
jgi:hypothetical protein